MMGSAGIASWIAYVAFWGLLLCGWLWDELRPPALVTFAILWIAGFYGLPFLGSGGAMFPSYVAILDVALVLLIFKGDVPLT
jgi:hypothetical protein